MKIFLLTLAFLILSGPALAQTGLAKLKEQWYEDGADQSVREFLFASSCNEYVTCQFNSFNDDSFGYGDLWKSKMNCSTCAGDTRRCLLSEVVEAGYQIIETKPDGDSVKIVLQRTTDKPEPKKGQPEQSPKSSK